MAEQSLTEPRRAMQIVGLVVTACVITNLAFYFLSSAYFADRAAQFGVATAEQVFSVRSAFAVFTAAIGVASVIAALRPRILGHAIAVLAGVMSLIAAFGAVSRGMNSVLCVTLAGVGVLLPLLTWKSLARARGAWSVLISLCAVYGLVLLFGAPKVRGVIGIGFWTALIFPGMLTVATVALAMIRDDYREAS